MNILKRFFLTAKGFFFPAVCAVCGISLTGAIEIRYGLCDKCRESLLPIDGSRCSLCGKPLISEIDLCMSCRNEKRKSTDKIWVLFPYTGKFRVLLTEYKFRRKTALADFFAEKVLAVLKEPLLKDVCIVPVPPRPGKIKGSGWDQVDFLVNRINKIAAGEVSVCRCLKRSKSKIQKRLGRKERMENLKGRIFTHGTVPQAAIVIDDIITTGSTMEACSAVLKESGVEKVYGLCLFYD